jgi:hypothetical protein
MNQLFTNYFLNLFKTELHESVALRLLSHLLVMTKQWEHSSAIKPSLSDGETYFQLLKKMTYFDLYQIN